MLLYHQIENFSFALGHISASLPNNLKVLGTHHYLVVVPAMDTFFDLNSDEVDGQTLISRILTLFIRYAHLNTAWPHRIILVISLQNGDV